MRAAEAIAAAVLTLGLVVVRPRGLNEGVSALAGGLLVLALGLVRPLDAVRLEAGQWNVYLFFLGMMGIAAIADQSGVFDVIADRAALVSGGSIVRLYLAVFLLGALISVFFANDSAALVLTPIVYALVLRLRLDPLPFVFATTFVADTASLALPVSNPLNVILTDRFGIALGPYVERMWLPSVLVVLVNLGVFLAMFRRHLGGRFARAPAAAAGTDVRSTLLLFVCVAAAYLVSSALRFPLGIVAVVGAVALGLDLARTGTLDPARGIREIGWPIFGFIGGMLLVVQALQGTGVTAVLGRALVSLGEGSQLGALASATIGSALGSNLVNNLPMALVMASALNDVHVAHPLRLDFVYGTIAGCDLGPNLTHLGSLATFIWLFFLRRKGLDISTWDYFRTGVIVTPMMILAATIGLWITSGGAR